MLMMSPTIRKSSKEKNRYFFFIEEFSVVKMAILRMYHFDTNLQEMTE